MARYEPVCVVNNAEEQFQNSNERKWEELEEFWGNDKEGIQDLDKISQSISCNLEKHLMYGKYANELGDKKLKESSSKMVRGTDVNDIPTIYNTNGFKPHELIVIGTYIDRNIIPGFQYKVRKNATDEYLFHGQALTLENIGLGYGKRLTFSGNNLNNNKNYFWSDSHPQGFGLTFQAITPNTVFRIIDINSNNDIGRIIVNDPARSEDIEIATDGNDSGFVEKIVKVHFSGDAVLSIANNKQKTFFEDMDVHGTAVVQRAGKVSKAQIKEIKLENFILESCLLVPEE